MGRQKKPIDLILAEGVNHVTKEEIAERKATELKIESKPINRPNFLPYDLREPYDKLAARLLELKIFTDLDEDLLGRYFVARELYVKYTSKLRAELKKRPPDFELVKNLQNNQDKAFRQVRDCANDLGLSVSSRVKLVIPNLENGGLSDEL